MACLAPASRRLRAVCSPAQMCWSSQLALLLALERQRQSSIHGQTCSVPRVHVSQVHQDSWVSVLLHALLASVEIVVGCCCNGLAAAAVCSSACQPLIGSSEAPNMSKLMVDYCILGVK